MAAKKKTTTRAAAKPTPPPKKKAVTKSPVAMKAPTKPTPGTPSRRDPEVTAFIDALDHPRKADLEQARALILDVSPEIHEGFKWKSPSFRTSEYFATLNVHAKDRLRLILHTGAKVKATAAAGVTIADPEGLLQWLAKDRCLVSFDEADAVLSSAKRRKALQAIISQWITLL